MKNDQKSVFSDFSKIHRKNLKKFGQLIQVAIHFHPIQTPLSIIIGNFCALVGLLTGISE